MKFKRNSLLSIFVVFVVFFFLFSAMEEVFSQKPPNARRIDMEPGVPEDWKDNLIPKINAMHRNLRTRFIRGSDEDGDFEAMARMLGQHAVIVYDATTYEGLEAIEGFWRTQRKIHDKVKFTLWKGWVYRDKEQVDERRYIGKSREIFWFEFNPDGEGEGSNGRRHRETCDWEEEGY